MIPLSLQSMIDEIIERYSSDELRVAVSALSGAYRNRKTGNGIKLSADEILRGAYLAVRFPATWAAITRCLSILDECRPDFAPRSMNDLGAGPGTASLAATFYYQELHALNLYEADKAFLDLSKILINGSDNTPKKVHYNLTDVKTAELTPADLVISSYMLNELNVSDHQSFITRVLESCKDVFLLLEPGTPAGFQNILRIRDYTIERGFHVLAPCPHESRCPMASTPSWCHFSERLPRLRRHRQLKGGTLGYEDEKFSYLILSRKHSSLDAHRIIAPVSKNKGSIAFDCCTTGGELRQVEVPRKQKSLYKLAKKKKWGETWEES